MLYNNALARNSTLGSCTYKYLLCHIPQACIPLSYAAQIPTTPNPDLANVRVSLSNLDQEVRQCSARYFVSVCVSRCMYEKSV